MNVKEGNYMAVVVKNFDPVVNMAVDVYVLKMEKEPFKSTKLQKLARTEDLY